MLGVLNFRRPVTQSRTRPELCWASDPLRSLCGRAPARDESGATTLLANLGPAPFRVVRSVLGANHPEAPNGCDEASLSVPVGLRDNSLAVLLIASLSSVAMGCHFFDRESPPAARPGPVSSARTVREALSPSGFDAEQVGGGEFYGNCVGAGAPDARIVDRAGLVAALANARPQTVIYVDDDAAIEITLDDTWDGSIPAGVTLASGRGHAGSLGGLVYTRSTVNKTLFTVRGPDVRITGLRIQGPMPQETEANCENGRKKNPTAILAERAGNIEIDNCELSGWSAAAIKMLENQANTNGTAGPKVHHNHIHHNRMQCRDFGLGYGVEVSATKRPVRASTADISYNLFDNNRHDIASNGMPTTGYTARWNLSVENTEAYSYDVHGCYDKYDEGFCSYCLTSEHHFHSAGDLVTIEGNAFLDATKWAVGIRGVPRIGATVSGNFFRHEQMGAGMPAIAQRRVHSTPPNCTCDDAGRPDCSCYRKAREPGCTCDAEPHAPGCRPKGGPDIVVPKDFVGVSAYHNQYRYDPGAAWFVSYGGTASWKFRRFSDEETTVPAFAYLDYEPGMDAFRANGSEWTLSSGARNSWQTLMASSVPRSQLAFGNLDEDPETAEVFHADGSKWRLWRFRKNPVRFDPTPVELNTSPITTSELRLVDLNGDGVSDVFRIRPNGQWAVSYGGRSEWQVLCTEAVALADLRFGSFNRSAGMDVARAKGGLWEVASWNTSSAACDWTPLPAGRHRDRPSLADVGFCDFDGDGMTDAFRAARGRWEIAGYPDYAWKVVGTSDIALASLALADVNGDHKCDLLARRKPW